MIMTLENERTNARIAELAAESCVALWRDYSVELTPASYNPDDPSEDPMLFGAIGFVGESLRATCLLGTHQRLLQASGRSGNQPRDWVAELSNQLIGRIKMRLLGCGVSVKVTTPLALSGIKLRPLPRLAPSPLAFTSAFGPVVVWLELECERGFVLPDEKPLSITPGDLVF
jgi:hypothetical protein